MLVCRALRLPEEAEDILKIFVMVPKQLYAEVVSELDSELAQNTLNAGDRVFHTPHYVQQLPNVAQCLGNAAGAADIDLGHSSFPSTVSGRASWHHTCLTTRLLHQLQYPGIPADELGPKVSESSEDSVCDVRSKVLQHRQSMLGPAMPHDTLHISKRPQAKAVSRTQACLSHTC